MDNTDQSKLLSQLLEVGRQMTETRALEPLLTYAVDISLELLDAQYGYLVLVDKDGKLDFRVARDRNGKDISMPDTQISRTILYRVIDQKKVLVTASAMQDEEFADAESVLSLHLKSVLCVPLVALGNAIGVIYMENRAHDDLFQESDAEPLKYLAGHAAVCIQNAMLSEEIEHLSRQRIDDLRQLSQEGQLSSELIKIAVEQERTRILYTFINDASHQFRTPLSVIKTSVDLIKRKADAVQTGNYLARIDEQIAVIVKLVDSLNLLATLDADIERKFYRDNLALIIHDMKDVLAVHAFRKDIEIQDFSADQVVEIELLQDYARQAVGKVLENAIMYTEPGGSITLDLVETDDAAHVIISDTGIGIAPEDLPKIMTRFFRVDTAGTTRGLGLGLTITQKIMAVHGGSITIDSELEQGTRVELIFPKLKR